jgi:hypothetical protein
MNFSTKNEKIIKFNCMIQDILDDEICCPLYKKNNEILPSLYNDQVEDEIVENFYIQRNVYFGIPIPGESYWVKDLFYQQDEQEKDSMIEEEESGILEQSKKRKRSEELLINKKNKNNPVQFKIKVFNENEVFKICEMIEIVGFLSEGDEEDERTIHMISYKRLKHPYLNYQLNTSNPRNLMLKYLETFFDPLTSEYVLLHFISRIYSRIGTKSLGKLSLNISDVHENFKIENLVENILPYYYIFNLNVKNLNESNFIPIKDYDNNKLNYGLLQLCNGTEFIINETGIHSFFKIHQN